MQNTEGKKLKHEIPSATGIKVYHEKGSCIRGSTIICECEHGIKKKGRLMKSGRKHGMTYIFKSDEKENAWAIITRPIRETGVYVLSEIIDIDTIVFNK